METYVLVDLQVALGVMILDMSELGRVVKSRHIPVQLAHPFVQGRIAASNFAQITLEVLVIHSVKANNGCVEANISFGYLVTKVVRARALSQIGLGTVERLEQSGHSFFIGILRSALALSLAQVMLPECLRCIYLRCEATAVDSIVYIIVGPLIDCLSYLAKRLGKEVKSALLRVGNQVVKGVVEHANNLTTLIVDNLVLLLVIESGDCETALVIWIDGEVNVAQMRETLVEGVWRHVGARLSLGLVRGCEAPPLLQHVPVHTRVRDEIF